MPKIYEYNPDTDTVRERERVEMKEKDMIAMMMEDNQGDHINPDREPSPYRNEFAEAVEILKRMNDKLDTCLLYTSPSPRDRQKSRMPSSA